MARNNFSQIRYRIHVLLECGHETNQLFMHMYARNEGERVICHECGESQEIIATEKSVVSVGKGW